MTVYISDFNLSEKKLDLCNFTIDICLSYVVKLDLKTYIFYHAKM